MNTSKSTGPVTLLVTCLLSICLALVPVWAKEPSITVFSAGSTINAITDITALFSQKHGIKAIPSFAASSTLARQIDKGAPADVYISANQKWMDYLEQRDMIVPDTRQNIVSNRIVLVAPADSPLSVITIDQHFDLVKVIGNGFMAMGDPDHVPAGIYGRQALEFFGLWDDIAQKIVRAKDVRAALALVIRKEVPVGQVFATDAAISDKVKIIGTFPGDSHPPIVYPAAIVVGRDTPESRKFMAFLNSTEARNGFLRYGFSMSEFDVSSD